MASAGFRTNNTLPSIVYNVIAGARHGVTDQAISRIAHINYESARRTRLNLVTEGLVSASKRVRRPTGTGRALTVWHAV